MILLFGIPSEPPLARVRAALDLRCAPYLLLNQRTFDGWTLEIEVSADRVGGTLGVDGQKYALNDFTGIYARPMDAANLPELSGEAPQSERRRRCLWLHDMLVRWLEFAPGRVLNRPSAMASNASKPFQAQLIRRAGFAIPPTLITTEPEEVERFGREEEHVIFKSISGARSIVTELGSEHSSRLDLLKHCPVQFQRRMPGVDVRVHTIGREAYASRAASDAVDYRYASRQGGETKLEAWRMPNELAERCVQLSRSLDLGFAGIDLKIAPSGEAVCFEVNPCPAFSYYEEHTHQPIADAVARHLSGGN